MSEPMTPAVPDPTVEAQIAEVLDDHRRGESSKDCFEGLGWVWACFCECGWHGRDRDHEAHVATELAPLLTARAAAPDALRVAVEAALADSRNQWWHTGGTPCIPRRVIRDLLDDPALAARATGGQG